MIRLIKLITGEEVIADIYENENELRLKEPVKMALTSQGIAMMPFCPFMNDNEIKINSKNVLFITEVDEEVLNAYNSKFGSGIVLANKSLIID